MYETILNHNYPNGKWIKAMTTHLVWNIDGDEKHKIITNDRKGDEKKHAESYFIKEIEGLELEHLVSKMYVSKKGKGTGGQKRLCITVYINNSPCSDCTNELITFLDENEWVRLKFYVTNLYNIHRKSCRSRKEFHLTKVDEDDHKKNSKGLKKLMKYERCEIRAFTKDVWEKLLDIVTVSKECRNELLNGYGNILNGNDRSRKIEDARIQKDLDHIRINGSLHAASDSDASGCNTDSESSESE